MGNRIAFMGVGAVGGYAGAHMAQAGEDVTFIDPWPAHVEKMQRDGLKISHIRDVPEFTVKVRALHLTDAQQLAKEKPIDIAFVCMKSYDTEWATTLISQYLAPNGFIVSLQNCMNEETIAGVVGWGKTVGCIASSITVDLCEPGHIRRAAGKSGSKHTVFRTGEVHGRVTDRVKEICSPGRHGGQRDGHREHLGRTLVETGDQRDGQRTVGLHRNARQGDGAATTRSVGSPPRLGSEAIRVGQALGYELEEIIHLDPEIIAQRRRRRCQGNARIRRAPAGRGEQGRRRASAVDGPGHGEGPPHGDRVPQRLRREEG